MRFVGKVWRLLVGVKDGLVLLFMLLFFGMLYAALSASPTVPRGARGALVLDLSGTIVEQPAPLQPLDLVGGSPLVREYRLRDLVSALDAAAEDDRVQAVALDLDIFTGGGQAALSSVGEALDRVRRANKPVVAYASTYTDDSYQLAAHASEVWLNPMGAVFIRGPGGTGLFFKELLDKIGVTANVYRAGEYKDAVEPFTRNDMSPESREALQAVAGVLWESWLEEIGRARPKARVRDYVADPEALFRRAGGDMARTALALGLVDKVGDRTAFGKRMAEIVGTADEKRPGSFKSIPFTPWSAAHPAGSSSGRIGVLTVAGEIVDGTAPTGTAGGETIARLLEKALSERNLSALVVRIDSPGGSAMASERIRLAVLEAKARGLPVVASMGNVAASGGYWVSTAADHVVAEPSTITGSIGVFGVLPSFRGTLDKIGIGTDGVKTTPLSGEPNPLAGPAPEMNRLLQMNVDNVYRRFLGIVAAARKMPLPRVAEIAEGRIWAGGTARQIGLVDSFGSLDDAIAEAARRANLDPDEVQEVYLDREPGFLESLFASFVSQEEEDVAEPAARDGFARLAGEPRLLMARAIADARRLLDGPTIQARCLECPSTSVPRVSREERRGIAALIDLLIS